MNTVQEISNAIAFGNLTNDDLNTVIEAVKYARQRLTQQTKRQLGMGDSVQFTSGKTGRTMQGTVQKIAIKYITVRTQEGLWRVPANMLTPV
jgi:ASC-1-like (ASCH) protein